MSTNNPMTPEQLDAIQMRLGCDTSTTEDVCILLAEVERLRTRAALADAMIERVARDTAAKESFTSRRQWEDIPHDERAHLRDHAHRVLAADLGTGEEA